MPDPRRLKITIEVDDEGSPEDYDQIMKALRSIGAEITDEQEV